MSEIINYLDEISKKPCRWMIMEGALLHSVISSRIRLARNIAGYRFCHRAKPDELEEIRTRVVEVSRNTSVFRKAIVIRLEDTSSIDRRLLLERHLISQEHTKSGKARGVIISQNEKDSIMVNEEDHIRIQSIYPGLALQEAWNCINRIDNDLDRELPFAFSPEWGYLTACPTNVGTGIRASVMLHLPALVITKQIDSILQKVTQAGLAVRGFYGEGSDSVGDLYQFSNQITLGQLEEDLVSTIESYVKQIISKEQNCRKQLLKEAKAKVEDVVYRAYGILSNARMINSREAMKLLSHIRLGVDYGWFDLNYSQLNELILFIQPSHLQKSIGKDLDESDRDILRAELIRMKLTHST